MNTGLGNLAALKDFILPAPMREQDDYDAMLAAIGAGVAAQVARFCNRKLAWAVDDTHDFPAGAPRYWLPRAPVASLAKIETLGASGEPVGELSGFIWNRAGLVDLRALTVSAEWLRATYTGGYWFETLEPTDDGFPSAPPAGATLLPADLRLAWLLQSQFVFEGKDHLLPKGLKDNQMIMTSTKDVKLTDGVKEMLRAFVRYQLL
ncbi:MAG: hypothetical protein LBK60_11100 [Verrucomicrobiales bacterium]|jgi:hypothetical protein|nr:hypothetical protein [Verrucomicrobiales bacterium]